MTKIPQNGSTGLVERQNENQPTSQRSVGEAEQLLGISTNTPITNLTTITNSPSGSGARSAAVLRFILQAKARELLPDQRVAWCLRRFRAGAVKVDIVRARARRAAYYDGLTRCSRIWTCPVCAAKITETRRLELTDLLNKNNVTVFQRGGRVLHFPRWHLTMLTYTIQHNGDEPFTAVMARLRRAWEVYTSGRWIQSFYQRFYIEGTIRALEVTHGAAGWHPHYHVLMFHDSQLPKMSTDPLRPNQAQMLQFARSRWCDVLAGVGGHADPIRGVDITTGKVEKYPLKLAGDREVREWGLTAETTKAVNKKGREGNRSLTDLLIDAARGDDRAAALWVEAVQGLKRQKHLEASKGLWTKLGREPLSSDEAAAEDTPQAGDEILASLNWLQWRAVLMADKRGELLDIAATGDVDRLWSFLESLGVHRDEV